MKIIHTSDWHLGRLLYGQKRSHEEFDFLSWLLDFIKENQVDALLLAGDIFDNANPSNQAQELYYDFLSDLNKTTCKNIIITAGNHDSANFIEAPKKILQSLNVYTVGKISENPQDLIFALKDKENIAKVLVAAVPYLRDRDIRRVKVGESFSTKESNIIFGIKNCYSEVDLAIKEKQKNYPKNLPLIVMGHLFVTGGSVQKNDGVRELYIGTLGQIPVDVFPKDIDYLALGHLHQPQVVAKNNNWRYSGAPFDFNFSDKPLKKSFCLIDFNDFKVEVREVEVPVFQALKRIKGDSKILLEKIKAINKPGLWLEIIHQGDEILPNLKNELLDIAYEKNLLVLRFVKQQMQTYLEQSQDTYGQTLEELNPKEVFEICLEENKVPLEKRDSLIHVYQEVLQELVEKE